MVLPSRTVRHVRVKTLAMKICSNPAAWSNAVPGDDGDGLKIARELPFHNEEVIHPELTRNYEARVLRLHFHRGAQDRGLQAANPQHWQLRPPIVCAAPHDVSFKAENQRAAEKALRRVRDAINLRSQGRAKAWNKWPASRSSAPVPVAPRVWPTYYTFDPLTATPRLKHATESLGVWQGALPNCGGQSRAAQDYLAATFPKVQTSTANLRVDHTFTIVGTVDPAFVEVPLDQWPPHLFVCDPWANISCAVPDYPLQFRERLEKWARDGKRLWLGNAWSSPMSPDLLSGAHALRSIDVRTNFSCGQSEVTQYRSQWLDSQLAAMSGNENGSGDKSGGPSAGDVALPARPRGAISTTRSPGDSR